MVHRLQLGGESIRGAEPGYRVRVRKRAPPGAQRRVGEAGLERESFRGGREGW